MQILPGVHWIRSVRGGNVYLLEEPDGLALIDTGWPGNTGSILKYIRSLERRPEELHTIILTHAHPDHFGSVQQLKKHTGAQVLIHEADTVLDDHSRPMLLPRGGPRRLMRARMLKRIPVDGALREGEVLPILGGLRVLHTPGHTPGSICLLMERHDALITGDTLLSNAQRLSRPMFFPESNVDDYWGSVRRLAAIAFEIALPGHGKPCLAEASEKAQTLIDLYTTRHPAWWRAIRNVPFLLKFGVAIMGRER